MYHIRRICQIQTLKRHGNDLKQHKISLNSHFPRYPGLAGGGVPHLFLDWGGVLHPALDRGVPQYPPCPDLGWGTPPPSPASVDRLKLLPSLILRMRTVTTGISYGQFYCHFHEVTYEMTLETTFLYWNKKVPLQETARGIQLAA